MAPHLLIVQKAYDIQSVNKKMSKTILVFALYGLPNY